jgi:dihydroorotase-like cyclic amidohydrolase
VSTTVFRNASVFDGFRHRGRVGDVVVSGGRIEAVGHGAVPGGATVVDVEGALLLPC